MKKRISGVILIVVFLVGMGLLLYPTVSDYWNSLHQSKAVSDYAEQVANLDAEKYEKLIQAARDYNASLLDKENRYWMSQENLDEYWNLLNVAGNGIIGYIEIPVIGCSLPIYHGVDEKILQIAIGHVDWSSLPVGGPGSHSVLSGHRGLPNAKLFTDLDKVAEGDLFVIRVLDEIITYEVDQILIVEPDQVESLDVDPGRDLCTLVTCTPYGINSHRLLVRGHRTENQPDATDVRVTGDATRIEPTMMAPLVATPMILALLIAMMISTRKRK